MYKISINETPLILRDLAEIPKDFESDEKNLILEYTGKPKLLLQAIDMLEKSQKRESITLYSNDYQQMVKDYNKLYKLVEAAGGLVFNPKGEILTMYRRGSWDLPKGKIDPGETKKQAAVREVEEETGIANIKLGKKICRTLHTYQLKDKRVLKYSFWYKMTAPKTKLVPQIEEDIEKCEWMKKSDFLKNCKPVYWNILEVLSKV